MLDFATFHDLWHQAQETPDQEQFASEAQGHCELPYTQLVLVHQAANSHAANLRAICGLTQAEMARRYDVPMSTANKWDCGLRAPTPWVHETLAYVMLADLFKD